MGDDFDETDWLENFRNLETWKRGAFIVLYVLVLWFVRIVLILLAALQFGSTLIVGRPVALALPFGRSLSLYIQQIALYITWNDDRRPWPWSSWPDPGGDASEGDEAGDAEDEPLAKAEPRRRNRPDPAGEEDDQGGGDVTPDPEPDSGDAGDVPAKDDGTGHPAPRKRKSAPRRDEDGSGSAPPRPDA